MTPTKTFYLSKRGTSGPADGETPQTPLVAWPEAVERVNAHRAGPNGHEPVSVLIERGSVLPAIGRFELSGLGTKAPLTVGAYVHPLRSSADILPLIHCTEDDIALNFWEPKDGRASIHDVNFEGINFVSDRLLDDTHDAIGFLFNGGTRNINFRGCKVSGFGTNFVTRAAEGFRNKNIVFEDSLIVDARPNPSGGHSNGFYSEGLDGLIFRGCCLDRNGWHPGIPGSRTIFNHDGYGQVDCTGLRMIDCLVSRGSSHGLQARAGGDVRRCLFAQNPVGVLFGGGNDPVPGGVNFHMEDTYAVECGDIDENTARGVGFWATNVKKGMMVRCGVLDTKSRAPEAAYWFQTDREHGGGVGYNVTLKDCVFRDHAGLAIYLEDRDSLRPTQQDRVSGLLRKLTAGPTLSQIAEEFGGNTTDWLLDFMRDRWVNQIPVAGRPGVFASEGRMILATVLDRLAAGFSEELHGA